MITTKALNARVANLYNLPETMTASQIEKASMGAFANYKFELVSTGEHITSISEFGMQLRFPNLGAFRNIHFSEQPEAREWSFNVSPEADRSW